MPHLPSTGTALHTLCTKHAVAAAARRRATPGPWRRRRCPRPPPPPAGRWTRSAAASPPSGVLPLSIKSINISIPRHAPGPGVGAQRPPSHPPAPHATSAPQSLAHIVGPSTIRSPARRSDILQQPGVVGTALAAGTLSAAGAAGGAWGTVRRMAPPENRGAVDAAGVALVGSIGAFAAWALGSS